MISMEMGHTNAVGMGLPSRLCVLLCMGGGKGKQQSGRRRW